MQKPGCFPPRTPGAPGLGQSLCSGTEHRALGKESLFWKGSVALRGPLCPGCCMIPLGLMLLEPPQESVRRVPAWGSETEQTRRAPDLGGGLGWDVTTRQTPWSLNPVPGIVAASRLLPTLFSQLLLRGVVGSSLEKRRPLLSTLP